MRSRWPASQASLISEALGPILLSLVLSTGSATAQVTAGGLGTRVNGSQFGSCQAGICVVQGGTHAGANLFHRFGQFDTRSGIRDVRIDTAGRGNVILGVAHPNGAFFNSPLNLSESANLFVLAPGGVWLGRGASFARVPNLLLSTGVALDLPGGRFQALSSKSADLANLEISPQLRFDAVATPGGQPGVIGAAGGGPLVIEGALLSMEGGLILDASTGRLSLQDAQLRAGESLRLSGGSFDVRESGLHAGQAGQRGLVELRTSLVDPVSETFGAGVLDRVQVSGQQISATAGNLLVRESEILAPKGWVELQTTNPSGAKADLLLDNSRILLTPKEESDLWSPQIIRRQQADGSVLENRNPPPHIGLFSRGQLRLDRSMLDGSLQLPAGAELGPEKILEALPSRVGQVITRSAGALTISNSEIKADSSHTLAGFLWLEAGAAIAGETSPGQLELRNSSLSASYGAGRGKIILKANDGLIVEQTTLQAITDRFPVIPGLPLDEELPLAYLGGYITLYNTSQSRPLEVLGSKLEALHHTGGGSLASPFLSSGVNSFNVGSFGESEEGWTEGIIYRYTGGYIQILSKGGMRIAEGSTLDASSRNPFNSQLENKPGLIRLVNFGPQSLELSDAALESLSGTQGNQTALASGSAGIFLLNPGGDIQVRDSKLDLRSATVSDPLLFLLAGKEVGVKGNSEIRLSSLPGALEPFFLLTSASANVTIEPSVIREAPPPFDFPFDVGDLSQILDENLNEFLLRNQIDFEKTYSASVSARSAWPLPLSTGAPNNLPPPEQAVLPSRPVETVPIQLQAEPAQQLLEGQQQALAETVASLALPAGSGRVRSVEELQQRLSRAATSRPAAPGEVPSTLGPSLAMAPYRPAILQLERTELPGSLVQLTAILLPATGEPVSHSQVVPAEHLQQAIRGLQRQLIRQEWVEANEANSPGALLAGWFLEPLAKALQASGSNALLLAVDRGLQAIPYAALPLAGQILGERYALSISPSLGLLDLDIGARRAEGGLLAVGASRFSQSLEPLPMVAKELGALAGEQEATVLLEEAFTAEALRRQSADDRYQRLHIATHADFQPGQNDSGRLYTKQGSLSLVELGASLRGRGQASALDLITLSACRTALGDEGSELGFVGMALQAGVRSGIGTLWKVDDAATAAFFVQYYRYLRSGLGKDQALQATVLAFRSGAVRLVGDALVGPRVRGPGEATLLTVSGAGERQRLSSGLSHPYFWAGMVLTGSPW